MTLTLTNANVSTMKLNMITYNYQSNAKLQTNYWLLLVSRASGKLLFKGGV